MTFITVRVVIMATMWPDFKFVLGNQKPLLYIGGYKLLFNRIRENKNGDNIAYFYCVNKLKAGFNCKSSAKATVVEADPDGDGDERYILSSYNSAHSEYCVPNSALLKVKEIRTEIKTTILANPTLKPSAVYAAKVDQVRDTLGEGFREEFDQIMPSRVQINPSIYVWKRSVIPPNPDLPGEIDTQCPFFMTQTGENICKASIDVAGNPMRRVILLTTERVLESGIRFSQRGVMDATFDVSIAIRFLL